MKSTAELSSCILSTLYSYFLKLLRFNSNSNDKMLGKGTKLALCNTSFTVSDDKWKSSHLILQAHCTLGP